MRLSLARFPSQGSTLKNLLVLLLVGSVLLTIDFDPQRRPLVHGDLIATISTGAARVAQNAITDALDKTAEIIKQLTVLSDHIATSEREIISATVSSVNRLLNEAALDKEIKEMLNEFELLINIVSARDQNLQLYMLSFGELEERTLKDFADKTLGEGEQSLKHYVNAIHVLVTGYNGRVKQKGLLEKLQIACEKFKSLICGFNLSAQQLIYELYKTVIIAERKSYKMMVISWEILRKYGMGNFTVESRIMHETFMQRTSEALNEVQRIMTQASREYWRCDPETNSQKEGETFLQITRLLQGYVVNEVDLNTRNTCKENCGHYTWGVVQEQCYDDRHCPRQTRCSGKIYDCQYLDKDMGACLPKGRNPRRYEFIEYENGKVLGQKKDCRQSPVESWWRWFYHCSYCFCMCDDDGSSSDRYISLRESVSDTKNNKVVTGLRFIKKKRVIFLIVQQGELLPQGQIKNDTLEWLEPEGFDILSKKYSSGRDFTALNRHNRIMDLDDIVLQPFHVLTGVRFRKLGTHINLEARVSKMDFKTGKLIDPNNIIWIGNNNPQQRRTELKLDRPHVPLLSPLPSVPDSTNNQFISFGASDREKDAAQTTVPFFDAQPVVPAKETPLGGCGIFHKGQPQYGGYLAPKVFTYDYSAHLHQITLSLTDF